MYCSMHTGRVAICAAKIATPSMCRGHLTLENTIVLTPKCAFINQIRGPCGMSISHLLFHAQNGPRDWLVVFYVPSTARSFRDGTSIYCPLRRTWSSVFTAFPPGIEPRAVAWQSITLPLRHASSTNNNDTLVGISIC